MASDSSHQPFSKVRFADIDAPELRQPQGRESKRALESLVLNRSVVVHWTKRDRYDIYCGVGHVYGPGDTVPDTVYVRASSLALKPSSDDTRTIVDDTISLVCHRLDTGAEVCRDDVKVSICNTPSVAPKGKTLYIWEEDYTDDSTHTSAQYFENALEDDLAGDGYHANPYPAEYFQLSSNSATVAAFEGLDEASILFTATHGSEGYVIPVAYPHTAAGGSNAVAWADALGTNWAFAVPGQTYEGGPTSWFVKVKTTYFTSEWKSQRDANDAMLFAVACKSAVSNAAAGLPAYIEAVGGGVAVGCEKSINGSTMAAAYTDMIEQMRQAKWRTVAGAFEIENMETDYDMTGTGKVTLWPAPLEGTTGGWYPKTHCSEGTALIVLDTGLDGTESVTLKKLSGDADMTGWTPFWITNSGYYCAIRWPYTKDTSSSVDTVIRARADKCYTPYTGATFSGKKLAGDGESCGRNKEWPF